MSTAKAQEMIEREGRGEKAVNLGGKQSAVGIIEADYQNVVGQDDLTRFDKKKNKNNGGHRGGRNNDHRNNNRSNHEKGNSSRAD